MSSAALPPWGWDAVATHWEAHPAWLIAGGVLLAGYLGAVASSRRQGHPVHPARVCSFVAGVGLLEVTLASAIDSYAMAIFWVHMVEHLLLIMVVPALLVLGRPLGVLADGLPASERDLLLGGLRSRPIAVLTHPLVGLAVYSVVIVGTHLTSFMDKMAMNAWLMPVEQIAYLLAGCWLLLPLIGAEPIRWQTPYLARIMLLLLAMVPDTLVGIVLLQSDDDPFPIMMSMHPSWAPPPIHDLHIGGALMWAGGDGLMMSIAVGVVVALISSENRRTQFLGDWLDGVRRQTFVDHVTEDGADQVSADIDPDGEDALAAYNRMLGRLDGR